MSLKSFENLNFDNSCLKRLPIDPETQNYVREVRKTLQPCQNYLCCRDSGQFRWKARFTAVLSPHQWTTPRSAYVWLAVAVWSPVPSVDHGLIVATTLSKAVTASGVLNMAVTVCVHAGGGVILAGIEPAGFGPGSGDIQPGLYSLFGRCDRLACRPCVVVHNSGCVQATR